ncbi:MAG: hypothetical protein R3D61_04700 [Defluviimonas denitrificans]
MLPYEQRLSGSCPAYLQQLEMESNGKRRHGRVDLWSKTPAPWSARRAGDERAARLYRLIHQGTRVIPANSCWGVRA